MIKAKYRGILVTGKWLLIDDDYWLLLTKAAAKRTGLSSIKYVKLRQISRYP
jgi:hypothetical protein